MCPEEWAGTLPRSHHSPSLFRLTASAQLHPWHWLQPSLAPSWPRATGNCAVRETRVQNRQWVWCPVRTPVSRVPNKPHLSLHVQSSVKQRHGAVSTLTALEGSFGLCTLHSDTKAGEDRATGFVQRFVVSGFPLLRSSSNFRVSGCRLRAAHLAFTGLQAGPQPWGHSLGGMAQCPREPSKVWQAPIGCQDRLWRARTVGTGESRCHWWPHLPGDGKSK